VAPQRGIHWYGSISNIFDLKYTQKYTHINVSGIALQMHMEQL